MNHAVITVRQHSRCTFMVIPGFFRQVVMVIIFISLVAISILLKRRFIAFVKPGFAKQIAMAVPGLQLLCISNLLHQEIALAVGILFRQEMSTNIIGIRLLGIALGGDHRLSFCTEEFLG